MDDKEMSIEIQNGVFILVLVLIVYSGVSFSFLSFAQSFHYYLVGFGGKIIRIAWGYIFAVIAGHFAISKYIDRLWFLIGWQTSNPDERPAHYLAYLLGIIERSLYFAALLANKPEFVGIWLALKVAGQWNRWGEKAKIGTVELEGRVFYNIFLIGSGLSIAYAFVGANIFMSMGKHEDKGYIGSWFAVAILPILLIIGTIALLPISYCWANRYRINKQNRGSNSQFE